MANRYKGVAVFGAPGSGKTTVAKALSRAFPRAGYIEAFDYVLNLAASIRDNLPGSEEKFIRKIAGFSQKAVSKKISREKARDFFIYLRNRYSRAVIVKTLDYLCRKKFPGKFMIISGIRGYKNAVYLKKHGYLILYLKAPWKSLVRRLSAREKFSKKSAEKERAIEERLFSTNKVEKIAHFSFDTDATPLRAVFTQIKALAEEKECLKCANTSANPAVHIRKSGLCDVCEKYKLNFDKTHLEKELRFLLSQKGTGTGRYDAMVGISGGKDSTATLYTVCGFGFKPLAFSLDTGYYPKHIFGRAMRVAGKLHTDFKKIDVRKYIRPADRVSFHKTAGLYAGKDSAELKEKFRRWYGEGRRHYSVKCGHKIPFIRTCQLCRRVIIRAYYGEALKYGARVIILGINEWAGLSQSTGSKKFVFSAIRRLKPFKNKPPVYVIHLPFLLQRKLKDTNRILKKLGWRVPRGEKLVESNANSCLFARAAENKARRLLGFHPDTSRLAREVTAGFITKKQAKRALAKTHNYPHSVEFILKKAKVI